jgi:hypothetical protein
MPGAGGRLSQLEIDRGLPATDWSGTGAAGDKGGLPSQRLFDFDAPTKEQRLSPVAALMRPGSLLFLGSVESTLDLCDRFTEVRPGKATIFERTGQ